MNIDSLMGLVNKKYGLDVALKPKQRAVISSVLEKKNSLGILPTGYGKSLTFILPPLLMDEADPENGPHVALIISPLNSLTADQVAHCNDMGIAAVAINALKKGALHSLRSASVIYGSPEQFLSPKWLSVVKQLKHVCLLAFDEVHCISEWGHDFRPDFKKSVELRSIFSRAPTLGLSATVNQTVLDDVLASLHLTEVELVSELPDRPNIYLEVKHQSKYDIEEDLCWVAEGLRQQQSKYPKTIIYAHSILQVVDIYEFLMDVLGVDGYVGGDVRPTNRLVSMFHGHIGVELQQFLVRTFSKFDSSVRVLVSTIAFGMGIAIQDIRQVIHWGKLGSVMSYWQEVGRSGRDGGPARAIWYPKSTQGQDKDLFDKLKTDTQTCIRHVILQHFLLDSMPSTLVDKYKVARLHCCSHCDARKH